MINYYSPREKLPVSHLGDVVFVSENKPLSWLIKIGQRIRHPWSEAKWNHVAIVCSVDVLIEARVFGGVRTRNLDEYDHLQRAVWTNDNISPQLKREDLSFLVEQIGHEYGIRDLISVAIRQIIGVWISIGEKSEPICSELAAESVQRLGIQLQYSPAQTSPADLFKELSETKDN